MSDDVKYREMKNPDDARASFRRQQLYDTERALLIAKTDLAAVDTLRNTAPEFAFDIGAEAVGLGQNVLEHQRKVDGLRGLTGVTDDELPIGQFITQFKNILAAEEEMYLRNEDQYENADAYAADPQAMRYQMLRSQCRVQAYQATLDDLEKKIEKTRKATKPKVGGTAHETPAS